MKKRRLVVFALALLACLSLLSLGACAKSYTVSFETNGGTAIQSVKVKENESYILPVPVKDDFVFDGWYLDSAFKGESVTSVQPTGDMTVYAKWSQLATITLDANGGSLSSTQIKLKEGQNVYEAVKDLQPTKTDCQFAYWTVNGKELSKNLTASANGITLTAKYKIKYQVNLYKQEITEDGKAGGYPATAEIITGYAFAGTEYDVTENHEFKGFYVSEATHDDQVTEKVISEKASENVFKVYYDRKTILVRFFSEYPDADLTEKVVNKNVLFGTKVELPVKDFACNGYMLSAWKDLTNNKTYAVNSVSEKLFDPETNKVGSNATPVTIDFDENTDLRAEWVKGIPDMYGGYDTLFLTKNDDGVEEAYILRGDIFFKCVYNGEEDGERIFTVETKDKLVDEGKIFEGNLYFAYSSSQRSKYNASRFISGKGLSSTEKMQFDAYNGVMYLFYDENGSVISEKTSNGTYEINESGYYVATFEDGELAGKTITFNLGTVSNQSAFQLRDEEEYGYGVMSLYVYSNGTLMSSETLGSPVRVVLTGFGIGLLYNSGSVSYVYYSRNNNVLTLQNTSGQELGTFKIIDYNDKKVFLSYNSGLDTTLTFEDEKGSLKMDGMYKATYTDGEGKVIEGTYLLSGSSVMGGTIIKFKSASYDASFIISATRETKTELVEGKPTVVEVIKYFLETKHYDYSERSYYGKDKRNKAAVNSNLVIVLNETESGEASVYVKVKIGEGTTATSKYEIIAKGTYTTNETGLYEITVTETFEIDGEIYEIPFNFDYSKLKKIVYDEASVSSQPVAYWYSYTLEEEEIQNIKEYTNSDTQTGGTIKVIDGSVAIVSVGSDKIIGSISTDSDTNLTTIAGSTYYYCVLDEEHLTFTVASRPFGAIIMERYGSANQYFTISFDGMGGATYNYLKEVDGKYETDAKGNYVSYSFKGTYYEVTNEKLKVGNAEYPVYIFETNEYMGEENSAKTIKFARIIMNNYYFAVFFKADEKDATYRVDGGLEKLKLDGYLIAEYTNEEGVTSTGIYTKNGNDIVFIGNEYYYFVVDGDKLTVKGNEFGTYLIIENQAPKKEYWVTLNGDAKNGEGTAKVFTYEREENGDYKYADGKLVEKVVSDEATYTYNTETGKIVLKFTDGSVAVTYEGILGTVSSGNSTISVFAIIHEEMAETYVDAANYNVLVLDSVGNAVFFGKMGTAKTGYYTLITDDLLFFMTSDGSSNGVGIYKYDRENHTIVLQEPDMPDAGYGYFTEEFEALFFTKYGIAQIEGESNYYYEYSSEDQNVTIYKQDPANADANDYGFVNLGNYSFDYQLTLNEKNYIRYEGRNLKAARTAEEQSKYPFRYNEGTELYEVKDITFRPTGKTFNITATVTLVEKETKTETTISATVLRKEIKVNSAGKEITDEEAKTEQYTTKTVTYLQIGYFEFDLALTYSASANEEGKAQFSVTGARLVKSGSSAYVINTAIFMQFFGQDATEYIKENLDKFGEMSIVETLDENGDVVKKAASGKYGEGTRYHDSEGNNLSFEDASNYIVNYKLDGTPYYTLDIKGKDGIDYRMNFSFGQTYGGTIGYTMNAFTRVQTEEIGNVKLVIERTLQADSGYKSGDLFKLAIFEKDGDEYKEVTQNAITYTPESAEGETGTKYAYVVRTRENEKITSSYHYIITLNDKDPEDKPYTAVRESSGQQTTTIVTSYEVSSFEKKEMKVYYDAAGNGRYVEIDSEHNVIIYGFDTTGGSSYLVTESTYDAETGVYTVIWKNDKQTLSVSFTVDDSNNTLTEKQ